MKVSLFLGACCFKKDMCEVSARGARFRDVFRGGVRVRTVDDRVLVIKIGGGTCARRCRAKLWRYGACGRSWDVMRGVGCEVRGLEAWVARFRNVGCEISGRSAKCDARGAWCDE